MASDKLAAGAFVAAAAVAVGALVYRQSKPAKKVSDDVAAILLTQTPKPPVREDPGHHAHDFSEEALATRVIHVGQEPDPVTGAVTVPISLASTFAQSSPGVASGSDSYYSYYKGYEYSRTNNPTRAAFEHAVASAETARHAIAFSSGSAATSAIIHLLKAGDHVISIDDVYGGTQRYFRRIVSGATGVEFSFVDLTQIELLREAIRPGHTKLIWMETPTNPTLKMADIAAVAKVAKENGVLLAVDNTFASAYFQRPLELGADMSVNSVTKFVNGHSDVVMGFVATNSDDILERLRFVQNGIGAVPAPFDCYMALRGFKTLAVRMQRHGENAMAVAKFLEAHDQVEKVLYPGLPSHPQHELAKRQMHGFGGMVTCYIKGGLDGARAFLENLHVFTLAESLGAVESLAESPAIMTHASVPPEERRKLKISDNLVRLSVGIEDINDLIRDLTVALARVAEANAS